jgi:succinate dehydrogenase/fumarate reductase flavoprotein subunit
MSSAEFLDREPDVLVIGAGNAALCAAISAHENGARVHAMSTRAPIPQPLLCQIWRRDHQAAGHVCLAGIRLQGDASAPRRVSHPSRDQGRRQHPRRAAHKLDGVDAETFLRTVREFNAACRTEVPFNPNILDGRKTEGLPINKTNWANPLDTPPFHAYHVTTGITFTFGGLKISTTGEVEDLYGRIIPGLYAAGEMVGGLFFHNYASGTGLMSGATFGRLAGRCATQFTLAGVSSDRAAQV